MPEILESADTQRPTISIPSLKPVRFFSAFVEQPKGISFAAQEPDEEIILFLRRHFITNLGWMVLSVVLVLVPFLLYFLADFFTDFFSLIPGRFLFIFICFYYLIVAGYVLLSFISWFYNIGIVTKKQIFDLDFTDIMYRNVAKVRIEDVIDVEFHQGGFLHSFFDYGDVFIQTEGIKPNFEFHSIPNAGKVSDVILDLKGQLVDNE